MNKFYINLEPYYNLLIITTLELKQITKDFIKRVKELKECGEVASNQEIVDRLEWNKTTMSTVMNGNGDIPPHYYRKFIDVYGSGNKVQPEVKDDTNKDKIIADQAATIKKLTDDVSRLIGLLTNSAANHQHISATLQPYLERIAAGGVGKFWKDERAGLIELNKILTSHLENGIESDI